MPSGEAEVVADHPAGPGLAAHGLLRSTPASAAPRTPRRWRRPARRDRRPRRRRRSPRRRRLADQAVRRRELGVGRVDEDPAVVQQDHGVGSRGHLRLTKRCPPGCGALDEAVRDPAVGEDPAHLVRPRTQPVPHHRDLAGAEADRPVPDPTRNSVTGAVEVLVGRVPRPDDVVVDLALGHEPGGSGRRCRGHPRHPTRRGGRGGHRGTASTPARRRCALPSRDAGLVRQEHGDLLLTQRRGAQQVAGNRGWPADTNPS